MYSAENHHNKKTLNRLIRKFKHNRTERGLLKLLNSVLEALRVRDEGLPLKDSKVSHLAKCEFKKVIDEIKLNPN
jgi:hypothetical protein